METERTFVAFEGDRLVAAAPLEPLLLQVKTRHDGGAVGTLLVFDEHTGQQVDFDLRGSPEEVLARALPPKPPVGRGRPKLGVVSREVSLLPRHWEWLEEQPQGASAALRRLVDEARRRDPGKAKARRERDAASRILSTMAGNLPGYEEATRAFFAGDEGAFATRVKGWPKDLRKYFVRRLAEVARLAAEPPDGAEA